MALVTTSCPHCGAQAATRIHRATIAGDDGDLEAYVSRGRSRTGHFAIVRCDGCGLVRQALRDDDLTLARAYSNLPAAPLPLAQAARQLRLVRSFVRREDRPKLLDVGAGDATFAHLATASFAVTALDPAPARANVNAIEWTSGRVEDATFEPESFDVVTLWDVIEHLAQPDAALARVARWLRADGTLFLETPNVASLAARTLGRRWPLWLREHLHYFDPRTIAALLDRAGLTIVHLEPALRAASAREVAIRLAAGLGSRARRAPSPAAVSRGRRSFTWRVPAGEMSVVARVRR